MPSWLPYLPHPTGLLLALMLALWLYESASLLYPTELLLVYQRRGWQYSCGQRQFQLRGRNLHLPTLGQLFQPVFRLSWQPSGCTTPVANWPDARQLQHWQRLRWPTASMTLTILLTGLAILHGNLNQIALGLVLFYGQLLLTLIWLWRLRASLGLSRRQLGSLAMEWFCCPLFAINLIRRLSLAQPTTIDGLGLAARLLPAPAWQALAAESGQVQQALLDFDQLPAAQRADARRLCQFLQSEAA